jgi:magnesium transporter
MTSLRDAISGSDAERIHGLLKNWTAPAIADEIKALSEVEQAVVIRVLPRQTAAATFEFLDRPVQERLLKAMGHTDVAAILNAMAPDDRTSLLEESPPAVTKHLLALLSDEERRVALSLLGYRAGSVGRLMTPHYVAIKEDWTVQQVLDHVREHGQDSETLNVLYVVDDAGILIDDIRVREFLLAPPGKLVSQIMDHRYVSLKATDDVKEAVALFEREDRKALPVTDTAGVLIGIVTIDDALSVAVQEATNEIQKIGGSEALDEPYMTITFWRMVRKRAGWLVLLFLGEMLTATANGIFRRRDRQGGGARVVRAIDHLQRGQFRLPGHHAGDPSACTR